MNEDFTVLLNGLAQGQNDFEARADKKFFESFENSEILDADLDVSVSVVKSGRFIGVDCGIEGSVTVTCDRCLGELDYPVSTGFSLSVKFGAEPSEETAETEDGREIVWLPESDAVLDLRQIVYDYVCLSLPVQRVHEDGECDPSVTKFLSFEDDTKNISEDSSSPFAGLKNLLENNKK